jgi:hypothetical protein
VTDAWPQVEVLLHVEAEHDVRVDIGPEERAEATPVIVGEPTRWGPQERAGQGRVEAGGAGRKGAGSLEAVGLPAPAAWLWLLGLNL